MGVLNGTCNLSVATSGTRSPDKSPSTSLRPTGGKLWLWEIHLPRSVLVQLLEVLSLEGSPSCGATQVRGSLDLALIGRSQRNKAGGLLRRQVCHPPKGDSQQRPRALGWG